MADMDIMPYDASSGGHVRIVDYPLDGSASFLRGEVVVVDAGGQLNEAATQPDVRPAGGTAAGAVGIAAESAQGIANSRTGDGLIATAVNQPAGVYTFDNDARFVTRQIFNNSDVVITPTVANIGDTCSLRLGAGTEGWGIDVGGTAGVENFVVEKVLDADGKDAALNATTAVSAVFRLGTGLG